MIATHNICRVLTALTLQLFLLCACSSGSTVQITGQESEAPTNKPRFRLEQVETSGTGLARNQVRKLVRMRLGMFRWCYESFL